MITHLIKLYQSRELLFNLVKRELKVKYKRSVFGFLWSFLNPIVLVTMYSIVIGNVMGMNRGIEAGFNGVKNFPAYILTGILAWTYLANSLVQATGSLVDSGNLVRKIYFPREIIPYAAVIANLVNYGFELVILVGFLSIIGIYFYAQIPFLILILLIQTFFILGLSSLLALANVYFRDTKHLISVFLLVWFWACPIIYPFKFVFDYLGGSPKALLLYKLNPMASIILMFQDVFYYGRTPSFKMLGFWLAFSIAFFAIALVIFKRKEEDIASEV